MIKKKMVAIMLCFGMLFSTSITAFAAESTEDYVSVLVENGYTVETAEALPVEDQKEIAEKLLSNPDDVDIATLSMEVDMLAEVESFFKCSEDDLIAMGATEEKITAIK